MFHFRCLLSRQSHPPSLGSFQLLSGRVELCTAKSIANSSGAVDSILYGTVGDHADGDDTLRGFQDENQEGHIGSIMLEPLIQFGKQQYIL